MLTVGFLKGISVFEMTPLQLNFRVVTTAGSASKCALVHSVFKITFSIIIGRSNGLHGIYKKC